VTSPIAISAFRQCATNYCHLVGTQLQGQSLPQGDFLAQVRVSLANLYAAALCLPDVEPTTEAVIPGLPHVIWQEMYEGLQAILPRDAFWEVFDPCQDDQPEPIIHSLSDALADTYCDLRSGFNALDDGMDPADVIWEWRFSFTSHWGHHVLDALRALACLAAITLWL